MSAARQATALQMAGCKSISVHVRRGDYITNPGALAFMALVLPNGMRWRWAGWRVTSKTRVFRIQRRPRLGARLFAEIRGDGFRRSAIRRTRLRGHAFNGKVPASYHRQQLIQLVGGVAKPFAR